MNILSYLQQVGRALMVPVATLPAAAILMEAGYWLDPDGWGAGNTLAALLIKSGSAIIDHMPALFAVGIAYGMSKDKDGAAALTGFVGFLVVTTLCSPVAVAMIQNIPADQVPFAFSKIENQFVGILVGTLSAEVYNRFSHIELPKALSFFSGRRLVPILVSLLMIVVSFILMYLWPVIFSGLVSFGEWIQKIGAPGAGIYAFFNRLLIPTGLHHALNSVFWFDVAGINDIPKFLGGAQSIANGRGIIGITGRYQAGFFPVMMFGLPAAALAIWQCARPENRAKVGSIMLAGAFAAFFTGITEPLEFSFMFVAPVLYLIHAFLMGVSVFIAAAMHWIAGFGFSAGLVDLVLSSRNPLATHWYMLIPQGLVFFVIYYLVFRFTIIRFNLKTPGRESGVASAEWEDNDQNISVDQHETKTERLARGYISAVGGSLNLKNIDACITRLRLSVTDMGQVNVRLAEQLGASGTICLDKQSVQIIVGTQAESLANAMKSVLAKGPVAASAAITQDPLPVSSAATEKLPSMAEDLVVATLVAPVSGQVLPLEQIPDRAFASQMVGDGLAILPDENIVVAPLSGTIVKIFKTNHAFCLQSDAGVELIVHLGLDTATLQGKGFKRLIKQGDKVKAGQPVLEMDLTRLNQHARSMISPVVIINPDHFGGLNLLAVQRVIAGKTEIFQVKKSLLS